MLSSSEITGVQSAVVDAFNLEVTLSTKQSNGTWAAQVTGMRCRIIPANSYERQEFANLGYSEPLDAEMRCSYNAAVVPGVEITVTKVNGAAPAAGQGHVYHVLMVDDLLSLGILMQCQLSRLS